MTALDAGHEAVGPPAEESSYIDRPASDPELDDIAVNLTRHPSEDRIPERLHPLPALGPSVASEVHGLPQRVTPRPTQPGGLRRDRWRHPARTPRRKLPLLECSLERRRCCAGRGRRGAVRPLPPWCDVFLRSSYLDARLAFPGGADVTGCRSLDDCAVGDRFSSWRADCGNSSRRRAQNRLQSRLEPVTKPQIATRRVGASIRITQHWATDRYLSRSTCSAVIAREFVARLAASHWNDSGGSASR